MRGASTYARWSVSSPESRSTSGPGSTSTPTRASIAAPASRNAPMRRSSPRPRCRRSTRAQGARRISMPAGTPGHDTPFDGKDHHGLPVHVDHTRVLKAGEVVDLTPDIKPNYDYFKTGPGYKALEG